MSFHMLVFNGCRILIEMFVCVLLVYDSVSGGSGLVGFQKFEQRMKLARLAHIYGMDGYWGVFFFRLLLYCVVFISGSFDLSGSSDGDLDIFTMLHHLEANPDPDSPNGLMPFLSQKEMMFPCALLVALFTLINQFWMYRTNKSHPWFEPLIRIEDDSINPHPITWSKLGSFMFTYTLIFTCTVLALDVQLLIPAIDLSGPNPTFAWQDKQMLIVAAVFIFVCLFKFATIALRKLDSEFAAQLTVWYSWTIIYGACVIGVHYGHSPVIENIILFGCIIVIATNLSYAVLTEVESTVNTVATFITYPLTRDGATVVLSLTASIFSIGSGIRAVNSARLSWFNVKYKVCAGLSTSAAAKAILADVSPGMVFWAEIMQYVLMAVLLISSVICCLFVAWERRANLTRAGLFWCCFGIFLANAAGWTTMDVLLDMFEKGISLDGAVNSSLEPDGMTQALEGHVCIIIAMIAQMVCCFIATATVNQDLVFLENPTFEDVQIAVHPTDDQGDIKLDKEEEARLKIEKEFKDELLNLAKEEAGNRGKPPVVCFDISKYRPSHKFMMSFVFALVCALAAHWHIREAVQDDWIMIDVPSFAADTFMVSKMEGSCSGCSGISNRVNAMTSLQNQVKNFAQSGSFTPYDFVHDLAKHALATCPMACVIVLFMGAVMSWIT
eukprot:707105_1